MDRRIQFTKIRDVKSPARANANDAGTDFFIPYYTEQFLADLKETIEQIIEITVTTIEITVSQKFILSIIVIIFQQIKM